MTNSEALTYEECKNEGAALLSVVDTLIEAKLLFNDNNKKFQIIRYSDKSLSVEYKESGFVFRLLSIQKKPQRSKVINIESSIMTFPALDFPKTRAIFYVFKSDKNGIFTQPHGFDISMIRLTTILTQAKTLMEKSELPKNKWVDLVAVLYCSIRENGTMYHSHSKNNTIHSAVDTLKFLKLGLNPYQIYDAWERNIDPISYRNIGVFLGDLPEEVLDAMFSS